MGHAYRAVGWNRQKKLYDRWLLGGVVLYLALFAGVGFATHPEATAETMIIRALGTGAFLLLHVILVIGPLCRLDPRFLPLLYNRRHMGVTMFALALGHGAFSTLQFHAFGDLNPLVSILVSNPRFDSLAHFPFQPLGLLALLILFLMAATSHDFWLGTLSAPPGIARFIGKAQEKSKVVRTEKRINPKTGQSYAWLVPSTAMVNQYYFYCVDKDFGPFFIKLGSYFPYTGKLCINGHEYLKRQLARRGVPFEALGNGLLSCEDAKRAQRICNGLTAAKIDALARKWLRRLPHPYTREDQSAGIRYEISMLQTEFSLTQVLDRPATGRAFFEEVIRDNLDLGRPDRVQLVFGRRITRSTPGRFRTRVITEGVYPSLHVDYKNTRIKQYHKEGRALRTETTVNDTYDFAIGRRLTNLPALKEVGFTANRRLLDVQRISHDCYIGEDAFQGMHRPTTVDGQRASALRFGDPRVLAVLSALLLFRLLPRGFRNRDLREHVAQIMGVELSQFSQGKMTYELRRLRLHGLIERIPGSHRYLVTEFGFRSALFITRAYLRLLRPGLADISSDKPPATTALRKAFTNVDDALERAWRHQSVAA